MRRRGKIGLAILALSLAGGGAYVGMERPRPPLVIAWRRSRKKRCRPRHKRKRRES